MSPDRYGEKQDPACRDPRCKRGWLGTDTEMRPIPCPACKPHLAVTTTSNDFAESKPSLRAQHAIESEQDR